MKLLLRALAILLVGVAVALAFVPLGSTSWADNMRTRRGNRGRPPAANFDRPVATPEATAAAANTAPPGDAPRPGRSPTDPGVPGRGGRGGRGGGTPGLFTHFNGNQSLAGDALRFTQIIVLQVGIPAGLTLAVLAAVRRRRKPAAGV